MPDPVVLPPDRDWGRAMDLCAEAFVDEPFMLAMFGPDRTEREQGARLLHAESTPWPHAILLGIEDGGVLLATAIVTPDGACHACAEGHLAEPEPGTIDHSEWEFRRNRAAAHAALGPHGWVGKVAVHPEARGRGLGRAMVAAARHSCPGPMVLECEPHRVAFYESCGFEVIGTFPDPVGPDLILMRTGSPA